MSTLTASLRRELDGASRVAVIGVGSDLRGDDAAGLLAARLIKKAFPRSSRVRVFFGETAPENCTGEIRRFEPSHLVLIDAARMDKRAGDIECFSPDGVGGATFSTHQLPVRVMLDYLAKSLPLRRAMIIGIQPASTEFGEPVSAAVKKAAERIAKAMKDVVG